MSVSLIPDVLLDRYAQLTPEWLKKRGITLLLSDLDYTLAPKSVRRPDDELKKLLQKKLLLQTARRREQSVNLSTSLLHLQSLSVLSVLSLPAQSQVRAAQRLLKSLTVQAYFQSAHLQLPLFSQSYLRLS